MKVIAGIDEDYEGEVILAQDTKVGYLPQEPELDESKNVRENVLDGVRDKVTILRQLEKVFFTLL
jgi:ATPase subunit of ABC transporter with duplicated ATPase domains